MNTDVDHEMYLKFEEYRYNAQAEGARPMDYHAWKSTPIAQGYLQKFEAQAEAPADEAPQRGVADRDALLRGGLFERVQKVLDGCNPEVANEFRNYGNLAEKQIQEREAELAQAVAALEDANDQILVHQGTLSILLAWITKSDGFLPADGFDDEAMVTLVEHDLEASHTVNAAKQAPSATGDQAAK